jgi:hypothetical protein
MTKIIGRINNGSEVIAYYEGQEVELETAISNNETSGKIEWVRQQLKIKAVDEAWNYIESKGFNRDRFLWLSNQKNNFRDEVSPEVLDMILAVEQWMDSVMILRLELFVKGQIAAGQEPDLDFSVCGNPPYQFLEIAALFMSQ